MKVQQLLRLVQVLAAGPLYITAAIGIKGVWPIDNVITVEE